MYKIHQIHTLGRPYGMCRSDVTLSYYKKYNRSNVHDGLSTYSNL